MADDRNPDTARAADAARVVQAAMAAIAAHGKGAAPPPNDRDPRRVTAHLGTYKIEAEYPAGRADAALTIDRDGALVLKARVEPVWRGDRREEDRIEILETRGNDWFADFLSLAPPVPAPAKDEGATAKSAGGAERKAKSKPSVKARAKRPAAERADKPKRGAKGAGAKKAPAKAPKTRARPKRAKTKRGRR